MTVGLDTSFFVKLLQGDRRAREIWEQVARRDIVAVISCISLYEIDKLAFKGAIARTAADTLLEEIVFVCQVVWIDALPRLRQAARIAHGSFFHSADLPAVRCSPTSSPDRNTDDCLS